MYVDAPKEEPINFVKDCYTAGMVISNAVAIITHHLRKSILDQNGEKLQLPELEKIFEEKIKLCSELIDAKSDSDCD